MSNVEVRNCTCNANNRRSFRRHAIAVSNGTAGLYLAVKALNLKKGSEVITPTLTFSTTVAPIYQLDLIPHFIDVGENTFTANLKQIEKAITKKTKAIMIPNLIGNVPNWREIHKIAKILEHF